MSELRPCPVERLTSYRACDMIQAWANCPDRRRVALDLEKLAEAVLHLRIEVNCRIEHGAKSGGHLEYVQEELDKILSTVRNWKEPT